MRSRAFESQSPHVRDVEQPRRLSRGRMFGDDRRVLDGHVEARELSHSRTLGQVPRCQRRGGQVGLGISGLGSSSLRRIRLGHPRLLSLIGHKARSYRRQTVGFLRSGDRSHGSLGKR